jgi:hypothetical protein
MATRRGSQVLQSFAAGLGLLAAAAFALSILGGL